MSFDIFDTALLRLVGATDSSAILLGQRLAAAGELSCTPEVFARSRIEAQRLACANLGVRQATIDEIYLELSYLMGLTADQRRRYADAEWALKAELLQPFPGAAERFAAHRQQHGRVVFTVDSFMPAAFFRQQLGRLGILQEGDEVHVSCEQRRGEASPAKSDRWVSNVDVLPGGEDETSRCVHFQEARLNRYEQTLEDQRWHTGAFSAVLAGASRRTRLSVGATNERQATIRDVAAGVTGPSLAAYLIWVLQQAKAEGMTRLYFVARDGQVMLQMARHLAPVVGFTGELRYLYGSRQAWHLPALERLGAREMDWLLDGPPTQVTLAGMLARVDMTVQDAAPALQAAGLRVSDGERSLHALGQANIENLLARPEFTAVLERKVELRRDLTLAYLRQERLCEDDRWALVDLGWVGRMQDSLSQLLAMCGAGPARGFYFGLLRRVEPATGWKRTYLFDTPAGHGFGCRFEHLPDIMEAMCTADHAGTFGYQLHDGRVAPRFKAHRLDELREWGLATLHETIGQYAERLAEGLRLTQAPLSGDVRPAVANILRSFLDSPSLSEARAWGAYPFETDQAGTFSNRMAMPYTWRDVLVSYIRGFVCASHPQHWTAGSMRVSSRAVRGALARVQRYTSPGWWPAKQYYRVQYRLDRLRRNMRQTVKSIQQMLRGQIPLP